MVLALSGARFQQRDLHFAHMWTCGIRGLQVWPHRRQRAVGRRNVVFCIFGFIGRTPYLRVGCSVKPPEGPVRLDGYPEEPVRLDGYLSQVNRVTRSPCGGTRRRSSTWSTCSYPGGGDVYAVASDAAGIVLRAQPSTVVENHHTLSILTTRGRKSPRKRAQYPIGRIPLGMFGVSPEVTDISCCLRHTIRCLRRTTCVQPTRSGLATDWLAGAGRRVRATARARAPRRDS